MPLPKPVTYADSAPPPARSGRKPKAVVTAEWVLWIWTVWDCLFGIVHSWLTIPEVSQKIAAQSGGMLTLDKGTILQCVFGMYALVFVTSAWVIWAISKGKPSGRKNLLIAFVLEVVVEGFSLGSDWVDYVADLIDLVSQVYALYLLYTQPGSRWFTSDNPANQPK